MPLTDGLQFFPKVLYDCTLPGHKTYGRKKSTAVGRGTAVRGAFNTGENSNVDRL
jgi:hypothetical protein